MNTYQVRYKDESLTHYGVKGMKWGVRKTPIQRPTTLSKTGVAAIVENASGGLAAEEEKMAKAYRDVMTKGFIRDLSADDAEKIIAYIHQKNEKLSPRDRISVQLQKDLHGNKYSVICDFEKWQKDEDKRDAESMKKEMARLQKERDEKKLSTKAKKASNYLVKRTKKLGKQIGNLFD